MTTERDLHAARAATFALSETVLGGELPKELTLLPRVAPVSQEQLINLMAEAEKPITCIALQLRTKMAVGWWSMTESGAEGHRELMGDMLEGLMRPERERVGDVVVTGRNWSVETTFSGMERLLSDYHLPGVDYLLHDSKKTSEGSQSRFELRVSRSTGGRVEGGTSS